MMENTKGEDFNLEDELKSLIQVYEDRVRVSPTHIGYTTYKQVVQELQALLYRSKEQEKG